MGFNSESDCLFIISPIVLYLVIVVNHDFSCVVFIQHHSNWLRGTESHRRSSGYEPDEILLLHPASLVTVYLVYGETHYTQIWALFQMRRLHVVPMQCVLRWCLRLRLHLKPTTPRALYCTLRAQLLSTSTACLAVTQSATSIAVFKDRQ